MNKLKMTIVMMIGIFFMVGMLGTACAQGSNFSVKADTIEYDMQSGQGKCSIETRWRYCNCC